MDSTWFWTIKLNKSSTPAASGITSQFIRLTNAIGGYTAAEHGGRAGPFFLTVAF
jgi:hypothetical protein